MKQQKPGSRVGDSMMFGLIEHAERVEEKQSGHIERQTEQAFAAPLQEIKQAAGYVRQNMEEVSWLMISLMFAGGLVVGLMLGYWPMRSSQNNMQEQLNRIEQYLAAQQPPVPASPDVHARAHKGKAK